MNTRKCWWGLLVTAAVAWGFSARLSADEGRASLTNRDTERSSSDADSNRRFARPQAGQESDDNGLRMKFVWCLPGQFVMGPVRFVDGKLVNEGAVAEDMQKRPLLQERKRANADQSPVGDEHDQQSETKVFLFRGYWLGKYEVTQGEWKQVMGTEPWKGQKYVKQGDDFPATYVSWDDATAFCQKLTEQERKAGRLSSDGEYALPTEAQWERACRARSETRYSFGNDESKLGEYAWYGLDTRQENEWCPRRVGQKKPNGWGLCDMHGNVWEWCRDSYIEKLPGGRDPEVAKGSGSRKERVIRGGSFASVASDCRSSSRLGFGPSLPYRGIGFRLARISSGEK
jgi:formylglycine-generating enzyme required for sulfatase activity